MSYWKILMLLFFIVGCKGSDSAGASSKLDATCVPIIDSFFKKIDSKNYNAAVDGLLSSNEDIDLKDSATISLKAKFSSINEVSGAFRGSGLIRKRNINDDIVAYSYLAKYDKKFYRFLFVFYNNGVRTSIYKFMFDDAVETELEESLKLYMY